MKVLLGALLALGCLAAAARAEEIAWRPAAPAATEPADPLVIQLGRPQPLDGASGAALQRATFVAPAVLELQPLAAMAPLGQMTPPVGLAPDASATMAAAVGAEANDVVLGSPDHAETPYPAETWHQQPLVPDDYEPLDFGGVPATLVGQQASRVYFMAEYLLWWTKGDRMPALVTTGPDPSPTSFNPANLGLRTTRILIGNDTLDPAPRSGIRASAGYWCDDEHCWGFEFGGFTLPNRSRDLSVSSAQYPLLARPFFTINPGPNFGESTEIAARQGIATAVVSVHSDSELWGLEPNIRHTLCCGCLPDGCTKYRLEALAGFRFLDLHDDLEIRENIQVAKTNPPASPALPNGGQAFVFDQFSTHNYFYGGQAGLHAEICRGPWSLDLETKLALGGTHQVVDIRGNSIQIDNVLGVTTAQGGLLALPTNIGHFTQDRFGVIPEVGLKVGYQVCDHVRVTLGYDLIYWNSVVRPGGQIDRNIDSTRIPFFVTTDTPTGLRAPAPLLATTDYWAQGLTVGLEFRY